jgi:hypothetical protein
MAQRTVRILAGIGQLAVGDLALSGAVYSLRIDKTGFCEGTVRANFRPLFHSAETRGRLRLNSGQTLDVRLEWIVPYEGRAFVTTEGPVVEI